MLLLSALPVLAVGKSAPKATGGYDYTVYDVDRHAEFNAIQTSIDCSSTWVVTGNYTISLDVNGAPYTEYLVLTQSDGNITGEYLALNPTGTQSRWNINSGTVAGDVIVINAQYQNNLSMMLIMEGAIASNGSISGTWHDVVWNTRSGNWSTTAGFAYKVASDGCEGKGTFNYSDETGLYYTLDVKYVSVEGNQAWFAGEWVSGNWGSPGTWLFIRVTYNGEPGFDDASAGDIIYSEATAKNLVASHAEPVLHGIVITGGNIQVHNPTP